MKRRVRRLICCAIPIVAIILVWPSGPVNLRNIESGKSAHHESAGWRAYYEEKYPTLFWQVFRFSNAMYGFSTGDSLRISWHAARAGMAFRRSNKPDDIAASRSHMRKYYRLVSKRCVEAMMMRDSLRTRKMTDADWDAIRHTLDKAAQNFEKALAAKASAAVPNT